MSFFLLLFAKSEFLHYHADVILYYIVSEV